MKYKGWIYCIRNKINNKKYIGQTALKRGCKYRFLGHIELLKRNKHYNKNLQEDFNKYGMDNFEFIILDEFTFTNKELLKKVLLDMEKFYINLWDTENDKKGYNIIFGGKNKKLIQCIETKEIFNGSEDVINKMFDGKGSSSTIRSHLNGISKSCYGYHFKYIEE